MLGRIRFASCGVPLGLTAAIAFADVLGPGTSGREEIEPGDVVRYAEDYAGRRWVVVGEHEFGRYTIRCFGDDYAKLLCIAEADEIAPVASRSPK